MPAAGCAAGGQVVRVAVAGGSLGWGCGYGPRLPTCVRVATPWTTPVATPRDSRHAAPRHGIACVCQENAGEELAACKAQLAESQGTVARLNSAMLLTRAAITAARTRANNLTLGSTPAAVVARRTREGKRRSSLVDKRDIPRLDSDNLARSAVERIWGSHASLRRVPKPQAGSAPEGGGQGNEGSPGPPKDSFASIDATPVPDTSFEASSDDDDGGVATTPSGSRFRAAGLAALSARSMASMVLVHAKSKRSLGPDTPSARSRSSWQRQRGRFSGAGPGAGAGSRSPGDSATPTARRSGRARSSSTPTGRGTPKRQRSRTPKRKGKGKKGSGRRGRSGASAGDGGADAQPRSRRKSWPPRLPEFADLSTTLEDIQWLAEVRGARVIAVQLPRCRLGTAAHERSCAALTHAGMRVRRSGGRRRRTRGVETAACCRCVQCTSAATCRYTC